MKLYITKGSPYARIVRVVVMVAACYIQAMLNFEFLLSENADFHYGVPVLPSRGWSAAMRHEPEIEGSMTAM
jgi:hypothetical protein